MFKCNQATVSVSFASIREMLERVHVVTAFNSIIRKRCVQGGIDLFVRRNVKSQCVGENLMLWDLKQG